MCVAQLVQESNSSVHALMNLSGLPCLLNNGNLFPLLLPLVISRVCMITRAGSASLKWLSGLLSTSLRQPNGWVEPRQICRT